MLEMVSRFCRDEEGAGMVEYALLVSLIAVALIATWTGLKGKINTLIEGIDFNGGG